MISNASYAPFAWVLEGFRGFGASKLKGKPLLLVFIHFSSSDVRSRFTMFLAITITFVFTLVLAALALLNLANPSIHYPNVATSLFERANAIEGQNPREANELRASAMAFLSVAR